MIILALDRAPSVRRRDANGFLHVGISNISKANVCPYYGQEIPNWQELGLDAERVYNLYRHPDELVKAAGTFSNIPLLSQHLPVMPDDLPEELIIGSTGTDASFDGTYLRNSLVVWSAEYQEAIEEDRQRELSCGYRYRADMTAGSTPDGLLYDGVMRDIMGNHVALVIEGRAGPDVMVGDEVMKLKSRTALAISGAIQAHVRPLLAADSRVDIASALAGADARGMAADGAPRALAGRISKLVKPYLAADKAIDADALAAAIGSVQLFALDEDRIDAEDEDPDGEQAEDEDPDDEQAKDEDLDPEPGAEDEDPDGKGDKDKGGGAMDSATVRQMVRDAETRARNAARRDAADLTRALADVKPIVGDVVGLDSAAAVYGFALDAAGYKPGEIRGAPIGTLRAMVAREVEHTRPRHPLAMDAAATRRANDSFAELYGSK
jgi:hypothetical protein